MGSFNASIQQPQTSGGTGKGAASVNRVRNTANTNVANNASAVFEPQYSTMADDFRSTRNESNQPSFGEVVGKGASGQKFTYSPTSGQPTVGAPNPYTNTVGQWDNATIQQPASRSGGKGKG